ncbi:unnamed protein product [Gongylonema pulchrum]|uniref:Uncharacterized protein n=1 Tax=Gongylonema pulchrum TaxID=637853 RepID=A0A183EN81_9BILA|nr:unnamed protein product [Gongylonema pulchrum]
MKKFDEPNNRLKEDPTLAAYGLRRLHIRQMPTSSGTSSARTYQNSDVSAAARSRRQNGKILDSWCSAADNAGATYFWNPDDAAALRAKNDINSPRNLSSSGGFGTTGGVGGGGGGGGSNLTSGHLPYNHHPAVATQQRVQKIVPSGYAPNRFPVSVSYTARPCWPKTYTFATPPTSPSYSSSTLPAANRVTNGAGGPLVVPSTSTFNNPSSSNGHAAERIIYPKSSCPSATTSNSGSASSPLPRRFENDNVAHTQALPSASLRNEKSHRIGRLGHGFFRRKLPITKCNGIKEGRGGGEGRRSGNNGGDSSTFPMPQSKSATTDTRSNSDFDDSRKQPVFWSASKNKNGWSFLFSFVS